MRIRIPSLLIAATIGLAPTPAGAADLEVFSTNFDSGIPATFTGAGFLEAVQGYAGVGPAGNTFTGSFLRDSTGWLGQPAQPVVLTLTNLPSHTSVDVRFLLATIDTWDGDFSVPNAPVPDRFILKVNGVAVFDRTICNSNYPNPQQSYVPAPGAALDTRPYADRGFQVRTDFGDVAWNFGAEPSLQNIPHTSSTLTVEWSAGGAGWQGDFDESFAIDNVQVVLHGVAPPVPGASALPLLLLNAALLAGGAWLLGRRRVPAVASRG